MAAGVLPLISNGKGRRFICCRRTRGISLSFAIQGNEHSYVSFASFVVRFVLSAKALAIDLNSPSNPDAVSALKDALAQVRRSRCRNWAWKMASWAMTKSRYLFPTFKRMESVFSPAAHDELLTGLNRAAEQAVPEAKTLLVDAIKI